MRTTHVPRPPLLAKSCLAVQTFAAPPLDHPSAAVSLPGHFHIAATGGDHPATAAP